MRLWIVIAFALAGCTHFSSDEKKAGEKVRVEDRKLHAETQALITGAKDALDQAPTNPPVQLAKKFVTRAQEIEGLPPTYMRYDVAGILGGNQQATNILSDRFESIHKVILERDAAALERDQAQAKLIELGRLYEAERNKSLVRRIWASIFSTLGIGGIIALCVLCPAVLPIVFAILGRVFAFVVEAVPRVAGFLGVVGKNTFDRTMAGIENYKTTQKEAGKTESAEALEASLSRKMDTPDKLLVKIRRPVVKQKFA